MSMSQSLARLEGRIPDDDYATKADLEQRMQLLRHSLRRMNDGPPALSHLQRGVAQTG